jgi:hypothetical protein
MAIIYGSIKPYEKILEAANEILEQYNYTQEDDYEPWDDCDGRDLAPHLYKWAEKLHDDAEYYLRLNSSYRE